jgi:hypothetical protein
MFCFAVRYCGTDSKPYGFDKKKKPGRQQARLLFFFL